MDALKKRFRRTCVTADYHARSIAEEALFASVDFAGGESGSYERESG